MTKGSSGGNRVFEHLLESDRHANTKRGFSVGAVSVVVHTALIALAVYATLGAREATTGVMVDTTMVYLNQPEQQEEQPQVVQLDVPLRGFQTVVAPTAIPTDIPPINLQEAFDPRDYTGSGVEGGLGTGLVPTGDHVYAETLVEEKPEQLSAPLPEYPPLLQQARIEGTVMVQVIVDTMGRAEPRSIRIVSSPNPGFEKPVRDALLKALFRPARVHGRPVRVLVQIPYVFKVPR